MRRRRGESFALTAYRARLRRLPADFRARYEEELVASVADLLARERARRGRLAAVILWSRAMIDAQSTIRAERPRASSSLAGWPGDLRQALRVIRRQPLYASVVVLTLALAIGGVTAVFTLADPILFRPLPYAEPDRIFFASVSGPGTFGGFALTPDFAGALHARSLAAVGTFDGPVVATLEGAAPDQDPLVGYRVTSAFLSVFGVTPALGRAFSAAEYDAAPLPPVNVAAQGASGQPALITDAVWRRVFAGRADVIGRTMAIRVARQATAVRVIGVLRPDFVLPDLNNQAPGFLLPGRRDVMAASTSGPGSLVELICRLAPDATVGQATGELQRILRDTERGSATVPAPRTMTLIPVSQILLGARTPMTVLLVVTLLILVLASASLAQLSLARLSARARELAVRRALGAGTWRVLRLLVVESAVLCGAGGLAAIGVGKALFVGVMDVMPRFAHVYRLVPAAIDGRVVAAAVVMAVVAFGAIGFWPAAVAVRQRADALRPGELSAPRTTRRRDAVLLTLQAALATSVLVVAALIVSSYVKLQGTVTGIDLDGLSTLTLQLPADVMKSQAEVVAIANQFDDDVERETGVRLARCSSCLPGVVGGRAFGRADAAADARSRVTAYAGDRAFLDDIRVVLRRGRLFTDEEARTNAPVAVVDEQAARALWPGADAIGQLARDRQSPGAAPRTVIGVVQTIDVTFGAASGPRGSAFVPIDPAAAGQSTFAWRGPLSPRALDAIRHIAQSLAPESAVSMSRTPPFERVLGQPLLMARLLGVLALLALAVTVAGIYSIVSHTVARRTGEIGVRMSLGASAARVRGMVVRESVLPVVAGVAIGGLICVWWTRTIKDLLFEIGPRNPWLFAAAGLVIVGVATVASALPARRASRIDPVVALRME